MTSGRDWLALIVTVALVVMLVLVVRSIARLVRSDDDEALTE